MVFEPDLELHVVALRIEAVNTLHDEAVLIDTPEDEGFPFLFHGER